MDNWYRAHTMSTSDTESSSTSKGIIASTGISHGSSHEQSNSVTLGSNHSEQRGVTQGASEEEGWSESETIAPFHEYHREEIISSRTFLSPEEQTLLAIQRMKELPQRTFCLKVPNHSALFVQAPQVDEPLVTKKTREAGLQRIHALPFYTHLHLEQHESPVIDIEARALPTPETKSLPQHSPAVHDDYEPPTFRHRRIADSPTQRPGPRQEKS